jgi:hypothetical protein
MDMRFLYVLPGWEGSASDGRVFQDARTTVFHVLKGKFYLGDAGYPNCNALLVPYHGVRYHLKEWGSLGLQFVTNLPEILTDQSIGLATQRSSSIWYMPEHAM